MGKFFDNDGGSCPRDDYGDTPALYDEARYPEGTKALQEEIDRLTTAYVTSRVAMSAAVVLHRKMHQCGGGWYTMDQSYKGDVAWLGPCPTLKALGVTK